MIGCAARTTEGMMTELDYWEECLSDGAYECELVISSEQLTALAESVKIGHEHYGMAFYSPPSSDRFKDIEREWKTKLAALQGELDTYQRNAEIAIKKALGQRSNDSVSIGAYGEVFLNGGRTEQIQ